MIAVSDTSPICYLILIGEIDILPNSTARGWCRRWWSRNCSTKMLQGAVRSWAANLPSWISAQQNSVGVTVGMEKLQAGEQAAILLAESAAADMSLLDEKSARRVAADLSLRITGTLGVLGEAAARGIVDLEAAIDQFRKTSFRYSPALLKATLDRFGNR